MKLTEIHHVSLVVSDLERAKNFYGIKLGLEELKRPSFDFEGAWYAVGVQQLHLIVQVEKEESVGTIKTRGRHAAFKVDQFNQAVQILEEKGITSIVKKSSTSGFHQIFFNDPDGNTIELMIDILK